MKKVLLIIVIIVALLIAGVNGYKHKLSIDGKKYLNEKYPNHDFEVGAVIYDFLYKRLSVGVYCRDIDVNFTLTLNNNGRDDFIEQVNLKKCKDLINKKIKGEDWLVYVEDVLGYPRDYNIITENMNVDVKEIVFDMYITYDENLIQNKEHFVDISHKIINALQQKNIKFSQIRFEEIKETDKEVTRYILHLENEDIYMDKEDIFQEIRISSKKEDITKRNE